MALNNFECCGAQARESLATRRGRDVSGTVTDDACWRIRADFEEMPDLTVTTRQAARFWAIDEQVAAAALQHLQERGILRQTRLGFRRSS
jgi:ribosomal protein S25